MTEPSAITSVGQISIAVTDVERATTFYRDVLGLEFLFEYPGMAFFNCGGVRLYLSAATDPAFAQTSILYYRVASIGAAAARLEAHGVAFDQQPAKVHEDDRHELWLAFFKDPEGNTLAIMSEVAK
jgi:methylmalonyl-CoA/ethylmalonyl-CoA epimerase